MQAWRGWAVTCSKGGRQVPDMARGLCKPADEIAASLEIRTGTAKSPC